jgi:predicted DCC family thiol-disulfide oxidoreductase YuxK
MKTLTIFYDPGCGLCMKFRQWLDTQPKRVAVEFIGYQSAEASRRFPGLLELRADRDVVVLADDGRWWQGSAAWVTCLWTTVRYRDWAFRLAAPVYQPFVKRAVYLLSENRLTLSRFMKLRTDGERAQAIRDTPAPPCGNDACAL